VNLSDGKTVGYGYDAEDRRVSKKINGVVQEKYIYDGEDIALVVNAAGTIVERYLYGEGVDHVLSRERAGAVTWSLAERQGSVTDLVNETGAVVNHFVYDSFGNRTGTTTADFRFGYTGRELDTETGLYYYRARYYDPMLGRFISEDPVGFSAGDTNLYRYVGNNATNFTDPSGEFANAIAGAGFGALFGGLYALANDLETGNFGWNTFGNVAKGAAVGALAGGLIGSGVGLVAGFATDALAAGFTTVLGANTALGTATAGAIVNTTLTAGFTAYGAYNAGGNFGSGKYLTGALDLFGVGLGAYNVFTGVTKGIPTTRWADLATAIDNLPLPGSPAGLNSSGAIVPAGSSALANRTSAWRQNNVDALIYDDSSTVGQFSNWDVSHFSEMVSSSFRDVNVNGLRSTNFGFEPRQIDLADPYLMRDAGTIIQAASQYYGISGTSLKSPVLATVMHRRLGIIEYGTNLKRFGTKDFNALHPVIQERLSNYELSGVTQGLNPRFLLGKGEPGSHAEVQATSRLLYKLEGQLGRQATESDLEDLLIYNIRLSGDRGGNLPGTSIIRCPNCQVLSGKAISLSDYPEIYLGLDPMAR
jgi:RHS repeat-associated protein